MLYDAQQLFILRDYPWYWIPPGLAIAWAERHLESLLALEPPLNEAAHAVLDDFAPRVLAEARAVEPAPATG